MAATYKPVLHFVVTPRLIVIRPVVNDGEDQCNNYESDNKPNRAGIKFAPKGTGLIIERVVVFEVVEEICLFGKPPPVNVNNLHMLVAF